MRIEGDEGRGIILEMMKAWQKGDGVVGGWEGEMR